MEGDRQRCLDAGMDGYLSKPFNAKDLYDLIEQVP
jgi:CheY-like chemotaxis protein